MKTRTLELIDIQEPEGVEITIRTSPRGLTLWVNIDGICRLRVTQIDVNRISFDTSTPIGTEVQP